MNLRNANLDWGYWEFTVSSAQQNVQKKKSSHYSQVVARLCAFTASDEIYRTVTADQYAPASIESVF
jgi:hypothetical protein